MNCAKCGKELYFWLGHPLFHYWEGTPSRIDRGFCGAVCSLRWFENPAPMPGRGSPEEIEEDRLNDYTSTYSRR